MVLKPLRVYRGWEQEEKRKTESQSVEIATYSSPGKVLEQMIEKTTFNHWNTTVIRRARKRT